jgi:hypothetical protein
MIIVLVTAVMMVGCAGQTNLISDNPKVSTELRVYNLPCMYEFEKGEAATAALLAPVVTSVISNTLSRFGSALRKIGQADTYTESDYRNFEISPNGNFQCIQVVKGRFGASDSAEMPLQEQPANKRDAINLIDKPDFFIELVAESSANRKFLRLIPTYFEYNRLLKSGSFTREKRTLVLQFSFHPAGKAADDDSAVGTTLGLGQLTTGTARNYTTQPHNNDPRGSESLWFPTFVPARKNKGGEANASSSAPPRPQDSASASAGAETSPMTMTITLAETRSERPFILFLADVFDEAKDEIQNELELFLLREKREEARLAEFTTQQNALAVSKAKIAAAQKKFIDYCAGGTGSSDSEKKERLTVSYELYAAQVAANIAARNAGEADPFPVLIEVSSEPPAGCP